MCTIIQASDIKKIFTLNLPSGVLIGKITNIKPKHHNVEITHDYKYGYIDIRPYPYYVKYNKQFEKDFTYNIPFAIDTINFCFSLNSNLTRNDYLFLSDLLEPSLLNSITLVDNEWDEFLNYNTIHDLLDNPNINIENDNLIFNYIHLSYTAHDNLQHIISSTHIDTMGG